MKKQNILTIAVLLSVLGGCSNNKLRDQLELPAMAPLPTAMGTIPEGGSPEFEAGWKDGCKTGLSTMGSNYYKTFYRFTQNLDLLHNDAYYQAWKDAYTYCRQYMFRWTLWKIDERESFR